MASEAKAEITSPAAKVERDLAAEALNHLIQGKRHLLVQDIPSAVASLQEACKLMVECHGEMANECGEAYFYYGKALLELARDEAGVFGTVLDEGKGDDDEEENGKNETEESDNDDEEQSEESEAASNDDKESEVEKQNDSDSAAKVAEDEPCTKKDSTERIEPSSSSVANPAVQPGSSTGKEESKKEEDDEEVTNLQLAWETLELAKIIFQRQSEGNQDILLKLAEVHLHLGEVGLESENYDQAVDDMQRCLAIRQDLLCQNDRLLAETHYQLGLALCFDNFFDEAIKHFQSAVGVIKDRIAGLKTKIKSRSEDKTLQDSSTKNDESTDSIQREIEDLEEILPEIEEKITDTEDMKKSTADKLREAAFNTGLLSSIKEEAEESLSSAPSFAGSSSEKVAKPIANISHLVKRKRKPDEDNSTATGQVEKKHRSEDASDFESVSSSAQELPVERVIRKSCNTKSEGSISLSADSAQVKNDSDVSSTTSFPSEEKQRRIAATDNEATESICPLKTRKAAVVCSGSEQGCAIGEALANGNESKKMVSSEGAQENVSTASSN